jgi:hypothetical protein
LSNADVRNALLRIAAKRIPSTRENIDAHVANLRRRHPRTDLG